MTIHGSTNISSLKAEILSDLMTAISTGPRTGARSRSGFELYRNPRSATHRLWPWTSYLTALRLVSSSIKWQRFLLCKFLMRIKRDDACATRVIKLKNTTDRFPEEQFWPKFADFLSSLWGSVWYKEEGQEEGKMDSKKDQEGPRWKELLEDMVK